MGQQASLQPGGERGRAMGSSLWGWISLHRPPTSGAAGEGQAGVECRGLASFLSPLLLPAYPGPPEGVRGNLGQVGRRELPRRPLHTESQGGCLHFGLQWVNVKGHPFLQGSEPSRPCTDGQRALTGSESQEPEHMAQPNSWAFLSLCDPEAWDPALHGKVKCRP